MVNNRFANTTNIVLNYEMPNHFKISPDRHEGYHGNGTFHLVKTTVVPLQQCFSSRENDCCTPTTTPCSALLLQTETENVNLPVCGGLTFLSMQF